jgi:hypothetical protein
MLPCKYIFCAANGYYKTKYRQQLFFVIEYFVLNVMIRNSKYHKPSERDRLVQGLWQVVLNQSMNSRGENGFTETSAGSLR